MWPKISSIARVLARECLGYENFSEGIPLPRAREVGYLYRRTPLGEIVQDIGVMYDYSEVQFHIQQWKYHRMRGV